jgi:CDP-diglyceride synthetase
MDNHAKRVKAGFGLGLSGLLALFVSKWFLAGLCCLLIWFAVGEFLIISRTRLPKRFNLIFKILCSTAPFAAIIGAKFLDCWLVLAVCLVLGGFLILNSKRYDLNFELKDLMNMLFCLLYLSWFSSHIVLLRTMGNPDNFSFNNLSEDIGIFYSLIPIILVVSNDTGSYYFGKAFGKTKLAEHISPNKTIKGALGGICTGLFFSLLFVAYIGPLFHIKVNWLYILVLCLLCNILAQMGDLVESLIKRSVGAKDSGDLIEGHGGVLDRFDSHIIPYAFCYHYFALINSF